MPSIAPNKEQHQQRGQKEEEGDDKWDLSAGQGSE
jgi:hypothetical protein